MVLQPAFKTNYSFKWKSHITEVWSWTSNLCGHKEQHESEKSEIKIVK